MADLPDDVTSFIDKHISSVMQLEVLLHLARHDEAFEPRQLSIALGGSADAVILSLEELQQHGLVKRVSEDDLAYRYAPRDTATNRGVEAVAAAYAKRKVAVVTRIFNRGDDLTSFSDAFRLRRR